MSNKGRQLEIKLKDKEAFEQFCIRRIKKVYGSQDEKSIFIKNEFYKAIGTNKETIDKLNKAKAREHLLDKVYENFAKIYDGKEIKNHPKREDLNSIEDAAERNHCKDMEVKDACNKWIKTNAVILNDKLIKEFNTTDAKGDDTMNKKADKAEETTEKKQEQIENPQEMVATFEDVPAFYETCKNLSKDELNKYKSGIKESSKAEAKSKILFEVVSKIPAEIEMTGPKWKAFLETKKIDIKSELKDPAKFAALVKEYEEYLASENKKEQQEAAPKEQVEKVKTEPAKPANPEALKINEIIESVENSKTKAPSEPEPTSVNRDLEDWEKAYEKAYKGVVGDENVKTTKKETGVDFEVKSGDATHKIEHKDKNNVSLGKDTPQNIVDTLVSTARDQGMTEVDIDKGGSNEFKAKMMIAALRAGLKISNESELISDKGKLISNDKDKVDNTLTAETKLALEAELKKREPALKQNEPAQEEPQEPAKKTPPLTEDELKKQRAAIRNKIRENHIAANPKLLEENPGLIADHFEFITAHPELIRGKKKLEDLHAELGEDKAKSKKYKGDNKDDNKNIRAEKVNESRRKGEVPYLSSEDIKDFGFDEDKVAGRNDKVKELEAARDKHRQERAAKAVIAAKGAERK